MSARNVIAVTALILCAGAFAQDYPVKPIRVLVGYAPGGGADAVARIIAQKLTERLGQTVLVDNRSGAAAMIAAELVAHATPDGYTLLVTDTPHTINPGMFKKVPYDPNRDFTPIALAASSPLALVVHPSVPAQTLQQFIELAKAQPGKLTLGSGGAITQLVGELFKLRTGINLTHVPYKGTGPAVADVIAGQIQSTFSTMPSVVPQFKAGKLRALGVSTRKRTAGAPEIPTFEEAGVKDFDAANWYGFQAPAGLPAPVLAILAAEIVRAVAQPDVRERFLNLALDPLTSTPQEFRVYIAAEVKKWAGIIKAANIQAE
jgi:tripartite-type tricarboxylate transporter receptor subunit TctC